MKFKGSSVRSLSKLLAFAQKHPKVRFIFATEGEPSVAWTKLGFNEVLEPGQYLVPGSVGSVTRFNAFGKENIRRDLPMVAKTFPVFTSWQDWHGQTHSGIQYREREVYQRDYVPAPLEPLYIVEKGSRLYIASREIDLAAESDASALHLANLMLECFGEFEPVDAASWVNVGTKLKRLQWEVLPPGEYPWSKAKPIVSRYTQHLDPSSRELIEYRMGTIAGFKPDFLAMGRGGFGGYFVYGFQAKGIFVLESGQLDNATYVFDSNWESLSQLTKNEIINGGIDHKRIIHDRRWSANVKKALFGR